MSIDTSIVGMVFALILFIIIFSAMTLYLAFRIKETFREEKRRGARVAKVAFMIGTLFLAGGIFYFFATNLMSGPSLPSSNGNEKPLLSLAISYPPTVTVSTGITISFTITNPTEYTAHDVVIQANVLFEQFSIDSSTHEVEGNVVRIGDVQPGTSVSSLELTSPDRPSNIQDLITLSFKEMDQPVTEELLISVRGRS
jgi:hypothetical protein